MSGGSPGLLLTLVEPQLHHIASAVERQQGHLAAAVNITIVWCAEEQWEPPLPQPGGGRTEMGVQREVGGTGGCLRKGDPQCLPSSQC